MHLTDDDLGRYAHEPALQRENSSIAAHLAACTQCRYRLLRAQLLGPFDNWNGTAKAAAEEDRRRAPRICFHERAMLRRLNPLLMGRWPVHVLDISHGGMKLHVPEALEPGATVQIRLPAALVTAEVRYCVSVGAEFQAGVRIIDAFLVNPDRSKNEQAQKPAGEGAEATAALRLV